MGRTGKFAAVCLTILGILAAGCTPKSAPAAKTEPTTSTNATATAPASDFPKKSITVLVPFAAGGAADLMSRALAEPVGKILGQPVVVENRPGGSGSVAMIALKDAAPDGYTLVMTSAGPSSLTPILSDSGYSYSDFLPIAQVTEFPIGLAVPNDSPIKSVSDFFKAVQEKPNQIKVGTSGKTLTQHITMEQLVAERNLKLNLVPFNGGAESVTAMLGGHVDAVFNVTQEILPQVQAGRFRMIGVTSEQRMADAKDVPTFKEQGIPLVKTIWYGVVAPKGVPADAAKKLQDAFKAAIDQPAVKEQFAKLFLPPGYTDGPALAARWKTEFDGNKKYFNK